jgi:hypothetical protein
MSSHNRYCCLNRAGRWVVVESRKAHCPPYRVVSGPVAFDDAVRICEERNALRKKKLKCKDLGTTFVRLQS